MSGAAGFALGGAFGMFMSSVDWGMTDEFRNMSTRQQLRVTARDMGTKAWSSARNFGKVGAIFSVTECLIESYRAKNDLTNSVAAGCFTGAYLSAQAGPQAMVFGCAGFAAFSAAIDHFMKEH
ncbi:hypothetical protein CXG81DRAFT_13584 [Caulochytrium protostelioides]|uniref:Mitochondrial import inner membrane translocase subunit TIM22 n=1 Tax=Caulochytrium protostelioides TaxID=1555241 RepID=A0A4P9X4X5_9FUNG|nr:mitochondrial import inner membrane translocase, subunit Tim17/22 [Caulochytrium protostelioides]RKP00143.1 hypothetical protein CXG81DRAFT_13584 [Caulochytrium protostelioides]|eukprot:RKP00143.1 hypothetical protein CXG81DRAFT_13584 [Caulochytrium protostelioides]